MDLPQLIKINDKIIPIAKETPFNERFGSWINLRFLIIIRFLLGNRIYVSKLMRNLSMKRLTFSATISAIITLWLVLLNLLLIVICNPGIVNPGPVISGLYQNARGFVPFRGLNQTVLPLSTTKLHDFQSSVYSRDPGLLILNETWLSSDHYDNEILSEDCFKLFRLDRSDKTHPYDPLNPRKYRKRGGGVMIAVNRKLDIQSKKVGKKVKAEILSVELKSGYDIFCITTCYRVGTLREENFREVENHLRSVTKVKKYKKHYFFGDLNLSNTSWPEALTSNDVEKLFIDLFDELGMQQMIEVPTHEQGNALDLCFVSNSSFIRNINVLTNNEICSSDHFGITFELTSRAKIKSSKRKIFDFKRAK